MNKMGKRFVALVIVFASIMSFLPIQFGLNGQAVKAVDASATDIEIGGVSVDQDTVNSSKKPIYTTQKQFDYFNITVKNQGLTGQAKTLMTQEVNIPIITDQKVIITMIDRIDIDETRISTAEYANNIKTLKSMGVTFEAASLTGRTGISIKGLPLGVNEIKYKVKVTETTRIYQHIELDKSTMLVDNPITTGEQIIKIEHGNGFVQDKIPYIDFKDYVGGRPGNPDTTLEDNARPFQYVERMYSTVGASLRFNHYLSNSVTDMDYKISFPSGLDTEQLDPHNDIVFVNGTNSNISTEGSKILTGSLKKTSTSTIMLLSIRHQSAAGEDSINNTYSIEIQYNNKDVPDDYALKDAGITKYNYNSDSTIKAFVGKEFTTTKENGVSIYTGTITIDKLADMINIKPTLGRDPATTAFKISNHYDKDIAYPQTGGDGKPYINFHKGTSNEIWLEVWEGKDGNTTGSSALAIYKLKVIIANTTSDSKVEFELLNNSADNPVYLTQPGRTEEIPFSSDRRTYDLYSKSDDVLLNLVKPSSTHHEYIRAWGGTSVQSDDVTEIMNLGTKSTANINIRDYKKIIVQAYYDEIVYKKNEKGDPIYDSNGKLEIESQTPNAIGQKYIFYIAKNAGSPDPNTGTSSSDATLSNIKASNGTVKSADNINYSVKVPKVDTSSGITVTTNSKVKDISATIVETGDEYGLTSGESFDFPLNTNGTTNIKVVVTAEDGITSKTYNITVTNDTRSASALLKNVVTDNGDFTFDPEASVNKIRVDQVIKKLKVAPVPTDSKSKVTVNGTKFSGSPITIDLAGSQQTDMTITVVSEDGSDSKTYSFEIYRTDAALENPDEDTNQDDVFYDEIDDCWVDTSKFEEWGKVKGKDIYFNNKGRQVKEQWINTKNSWYYLNSKGYKTSGWRKDIGGKSYYLDPTTGELKTGWMNINNKMYYLGLNGVMQKGWLYLNSKWYYFTPEGEMVTNQSMFINDKVYNFRQDGVMY